MLRVEADLALLEVAEARPDTAALAALMVATAVATAAATAVATAAVGAVGAEAPLSPPTLAGTT